MNGKGRAGSPLPAALSRLRESEPPKAGAQRSARPTPHPSPKSSLLNIGVCSADFPLRGFSAFASELGLSISLDLVPNHRVQHPQTLRQDLRPRMSVTGPGPEARQQRHQDVRLQQRESGRRQELA